MIWSKLCVHIFYPLLPPQLFNLVTIPPETCIKFASTSSGAHKKVPNQWQKTLDRPRFGTNQCSFWKVSSKKYTVQWSWPSNRSRFSSRSRPDIWYIVDSLLGSIIFYIPSQINSSSLTSISWINLPMQRCLPLAEDNWNKMRSRLTDQHLIYCLHLCLSNEPPFSKPWQDMQC